MLFCLDFSPPGLLRTLLPHSFFFLHNNLSLKLGKIYKTENLTFSSLFYSIHFSSIQNIHMVMQTSSPSISRTETVCVLNHFGCARLSVTLWAVACQAPLSTKFSRQEYWSGLPFPSLGDLPDPDIKPGSPIFRQIHSCLSHHGSHIT